MPNSEATRERASTELSRKGRVDMNSKALEAAREINSTCFAGTEFNAEAVNEWAAIISRVCKLEEAEKMRHALKHISGMTCGCYSNTKENWHSERCFAAKAKAALAAFDAKDGQ